MHLSRIALVVLLGGICACSPSPQESSEPPGPEPKKAPQIHDDSPGERRSTAFGLPLPPRVSRMEERPGYVVVHTNLNVRQLHTFFQENLPSGFELLKTGYKLQIVGLKDFQPEVTAAHIMGQRSPVRLVYRAIRQAPSVKYESLTPEGRKRAKAKLQAAFERNKKSIPKRGTPVELRTKSGKLLAPGARWYEPYTPPKGSPLDQPHLRSNFGRPFGMWQPG